MARLTKKQEDFAQRVAEGMPLVDAYTESYATKKSTRASQHENASRLAANIKVAARIAELRDKAAEKCVCTVESMAREFEELAIKAAKHKQYSAATQAQTQRAKLLGLYEDHNRQKSQQTTVAINLTGDARA